MPTFFQLIAILSLFWAIPYLIRMGWGMAAAQTQRRCHLCHRSIETLNQMYEQAILAIQHDKQKQHNHEQ